jgi:hypothetical protein
MLNIIRITCALLFVSVAACVDTPEVTESTTEQSSELCDTCGTLDPNPTPACDVVCGDTTPCATACIDAKGTETTCLAIEICDPVELEKAREGRNPQTGKTIQMPAKSTLQR